MDSVQPSFSRQVAKRIAVSPVACRCVAEVMKLLNAVRDSIGSSFLGGVSHKQNEPKAGWLFESVSILCKAIP